MHDEWEYAPDVLERVIEKYGENSTPAKITRRWCAERKAVSQAASRMLKKLGTGYQAAITSFDWRRGKKYVCTIR